jgi:alcohol dehydrogenase
MEVAEKKPARGLAGEEKISRELKPMVLVPVALVSGNEAANRAYIDGLACISHFLSPDVVVIDHRMTSTAETRPTLYSGLTALAHAVEAAISVSANPMIDAYAYASLRLLCEHLPAAVKKPSDKKSSVAVANAAALAAIAFSNAPAGMAHYLAEALADGTGIDPGICMGLLVRALLKTRIVEKKGIREELCLALAGPGMFSAAPASGRAKAALGAIDGTFADLGGMMPGSLREIGVTQQRLNEAVREAVKASPSKLSAKECMAVIGRAWNGK